MTFCTTINCIDGRVQLPVIRYLQERFDAEYVDSIKAGPNRILAEQNDPARIQSILERLRISVEKHYSVGIAIVGHHDCAGNPAPKTEQIAHIKGAIRYIRSYFAELTVIGLWGDSEWHVHELDEKDESFSSSDRCTF